MSEFLHVGLSVRGAIKSGAWRHELVGALTINGEKITPEEIFEALCDALASGREMLPIGNDCDNFDDKKGCLGHDGDEKHKTKKVTRHAKQTPAA